MIGMLRCRCWVAGVSRIRHTHTHARLISQDIKDGPSPMTAHSTIIIIKCVCFGSTAPASKPVITDAKGIEMRNVSGLYDRGTPLTLICTVTQGMAHPIPSITFLSSFYLFQALSLCFSFSFPGSRWKYHPFVFLHVGFQFPLDCHWQNSSANLNSIVIRYSWVHFLHAIQIIVGIGHETDNLWTRQSPVFLFCLLS